jgi:hypothetical protein
LNSDKESDPSNSSEKNLEGVINPTHKSIESVFLTKKESIRPDSNLISRDQLGEKLDISVQKRFIEKDSAYSFLALDFKIKNKSDSDIKDFLIKKNIIGLFKPLIQFNLNIYFTKASPTIIATFSNKKMSYKRPEKSLKSEKCIEFSVNLKFFELDKYEESYVEVHFVEG